MGPLAIAIVGGIAAGVVVAAGVKVYDYVQEANKEADAWEGLFNLCERSAKNRPDVFERLGCWYSRGDTDLDDKSIAFRVTIGGVNQGRLYFQKNPWYQADKVFVVGPNDTIDWKSDAQVVDPAELRKTIVAQAGMIARSQQSSDMVPA